MNKLKSIISPHEKEDTTGTSSVGNRASSGSYANDATTGTSSHGLTGNTSSSTGTGLAGTNPSESERSGLASSGVTDNDGSRGVGAATTAGHGHGLFGKHELGHSNKPDTKFDPSGENVTHEHQHLAHVTHKDVRHQEVEEVQRERQHDRHVHHLQHHVQPVKDVQVQEEVHHNKAHPVTKIEEHHSNTAEDTKLFKSLGERHRDEESHRPKERTVVDLGERVNETVHHHVHHVTQPVVEQEVHDRHRIHTTIPLTHTTHEAPIIHKSSLHEPVSMDEFKKGGGVLGSNVTHENAGILKTGDCSRSVDGIGEKLTQELNLKPSALHHSSGTTAL